MNEISELLHHELNSIAKEDEINTINSLPDNRHTTTQNYSVGTPVSYHHKRKLPDYGVSRVGKSYVIDKDSHGYRTFLNSQKHQKELRRKYGISRENEIRDARTGLLSSSFFDRDIIKKYGDCARTHNPLCLTIFDMRSFKTINDQYGHAVGNWVLSSLGEAVRKLKLRVTDSAYRIGGDEFAFLLPNICSEDKRSNLSNKDRVVIKNLQMLKQLQLKLTKTISTDKSSKTGLDFGVTWTEGEEKPHSSILYDRADNAMYLSKALKASDNGMIVVASIEGHKTTYEIARLDFNDSKVHYEVIKNASELLKSKPKN